MSVGASTELLVEEQPEDVVVVPGDVTARSPRQLFWRRLRADKVAMASAVIIVLLILIAILAGPFTHLLGLPAPNTQDANATDAFGSPLGPTSGHPFGVDELGRDVASRTIYGARVSLEVGLLGTAISLVVGTVIGLLAGFFRGIVDTVLSRFVEVFLAFPVLVLGLGIGAACSVKGCAGGVIQPGLGTIIFIITISNFTYIARIARGQVLSLREREFVEAARSLGASNARILFREILPNLLTPLIVYSSLLIPTNILFEAALSFLGVGIRPPTSSWGQMISDASNYLTPPAAWWYMVFPGGALVITVLAFNLLGDGLLDALNPRAESR